MNSVKSLRKYFKVLFLSTMLVALSHAIVGANSIPGLQISVDVEFASAAETPGVAILEVRISAPNPFGMTEVNIVPYRNLQTTGNLTWQDDLSGTTEHIYNIEVIVPSNDTSGLEIWVTSYADRVQSGWGGLFFVTTGDTLVTLHYPPHHQRELERRQREREMAVIPRTYCDQLTLAVKRKPGGSPTQPTIRIGVWPTSGYCEEITVKLVADTGVEVIGDTRWVVNPHIDTEPEFRDVLFSIYASDTGWADLTVTCRDSVIVRDLVFVRHGDSTECWLGHPGTEDRWSISY